MRSVTSEKGMRSRGRCAPRGRLRWFFRPAQRVQNLVRVLALIKVCFLRANFPGAGIFVRHTSKKSLVIYHICWQRTP